MGTDVADQVSGSVSVAVGVAIETSYAAASVLRTPIFSLVVMLLRKNRKEQAEAFDLLGVEDAIKQFVVVIEGDELALGNVTEVGAGRAVVFRS